LSERSKVFILAISCLVFAQVCASLLIPQGFALTIFSDVIQCILLLAGIAALLPNVMRTQGRVRLFWALITLGIAFWLIYQLLWSYFEVVLRQEVPDPFVGDIIIFLHFVPMMAALALRPHAKEDEHAARVGRMDFVLLLTWWVYLYLFAVIPWQYAHVDELTYSRSLNTLYLTEKIVFLAGLALVWVGRKAAWRMIYAQFFGASLLYAASSYVANWAIQHNVYYSGSLYDLPVAASMAWISAIGVLAQDLKPEQERTGPAGRRGLWLARLGMTVIFSLPIFAGWSLFDTGVPSSVRTFRLVLTLITMMVMGGLVFLRQHLLDRELVRLLSTSQESFDNLKQLQSQLIQSEKLASLGQLVGGAAHELNNPLTAMLGYSELLASSGLNEDQRAIAQKITQQVRHTRVLISNLLNFARPTPATKSRVDINSIAHTAISLCQTQFGPSRVEIRLQLAQHVPSVIADPNQILQVFLHIATHSMQAMDEQGGGTVFVTTLAAEEQVSIEFRSKPADERSCKDHTSQPPGLGLSACDGIVQQHDGKLMCNDSSSGEYSIRIDLPVAPPPSAAISDFTLRSPLYRASGASVSS
jgi:signal transduction histidine kinase